MILFLTTVFLGFFAMLNPIGNTPVFLAMVGSANDKTIKRVAFKAVMVAFMIITVFCIFGHVIFRMFGITLPAFQIAGGIIVFFIGYELLQGKTARAHRSMKNLPPESYEDMAISPLGIPLLSGPGTISTAMNFVGEGKEFFKCFAHHSHLCRCVLYYLPDVYHEQKIADKLNPSLITVITKIMGLILTVIAVQMLINGVFKVILEFPRV